MAPDRPETILYAVYKRLQGNSTLCSSFCWHAGPWLGNLQFWPLLWYRQGHSWYSDWLICMCQLWGTWDVCRCLLYNERFQYSPQQESRVQGGQQGYQATCAWYSAHRCNGGRQWCCRTYPGSAAPGLTLTYLFLLKNLVDIPCISFLSLKRISQIYPILICDIQDILRTTNRYPGHIFGGKRYFRYIP